MKKLLVLFSFCGMHLSNAEYANQQVMQLQAVVVQAATPQAQKTVSKMVGLCKDAIAVKEFGALVRSHSAETLHFVAAKLKAELTDDERTQLVTLLRELFDWYTQFIALAIDVNALQTQQGQDRYMQHQMKLLMFLQHPLAAAIAMQLLSLEKNEMIFNELSESFGLLLKEQFNLFVTELS